MGDTDARKEKSEAIQKKIADYAFLFHSAPTKEETGG
jgi:hypothetical protein